MTPYCTLELDSDGILLLPREQDFSDAELADLNVVLDPFGKTELAKGHDGDWDALWAQSASRFASKLETRGGVLVVGGPGMVKAYRGGPPAGRVVLARTSVPWEADEVWAGDASTAFGFGQEPVNLPLSHFEEVLNLALVEPGSDEVFPSLFLWGSQSATEHGERIVRSDWRWKPQAGGMAMVWRSRRGKRVSLQFLTGARTAGGQVVLHGQSRPGSDLFRARIVGQARDGSWMVEPVE